MRKLVSIAVMAVALLSGSARAVEITDLYRSQAIVTGIFEPERTRGLRLALLDVLVKVAAEPRLLDDPRVPKLLERATDFVASYDYEDRMKHKPVNDDQGTRDRPYDLRVVFDRAKIDAALGELGLQPWSSDRPPLLAQVTVEYPTGKYRLTEDGDQGLGQKQALAAAAMRRGMTVTLPLAAAASPVVAAGQPLLEGTLRWQEAKTAWRTDWTLTEVGLQATGTPSLATRKRSWTVETTSFDEAFRNGVGEAAATLAGRR